MKHIMIAVSVTAMCLGVVASDPVKLNGTQTFGSNFNSATAWKDGEPAQEGKDYLVTDDCQLQVGYGTTGNSIFSFPGDSLAIGEVGGSTGVLCHGGALELTVPNLILANGHYWSYYSWGYSYTSELMGKATVVSPESAPFRIIPFADSANHRGLLWYMELVGEAGCGLLIEGVKKASVTGSMEILSSNPKYHGSMRVRCPNLTLKIAESDSLGGKLATFNAKALVLAEQATLAASVDGLELSASDNRGIFVESTGGSIAVPAGMTMTVGWPISGEGTLTKKGAGDLAISNTVSLSSVVLAEGGISAAPGTVAEFQELVFAGGCLSTREGGGVLSVGSLRMNAGGRIPVRVSGDPAIGAVLPFFRAQAGEFGIDDFEVLSGSGTWGAPFAKVTNIVESASETFALVVLPLVETAGEGDGGVFYASEASHWSDGRTVHEDAAYLVRATSGAKSFEALPDGSGTGCSFSGRSLILSGSSSSLQAKLTDSAADFCGNVKFYDYSRMQFGSIAAPAVYTIRGRIELNTSYNNENGNAWVLKSGTTSVVESVVSGSGWMYFSNHSSAGTWGTVEFSGTNTYTGGMHLYGGEKFVCLRVGDERNLGVNPPVLNDGALLLSGGAVLHPKGSVTIDDPNRGVRVSGSKSYIKTDKGETTSILSPVFAVSATTHVTGGGTLFIGGEFTRVNADRVSSFFIDDGFLKCGASRSFAAEKFTFAEGTGFAADIVTDASDDRSVYGTILSNADNVFPSVLKVRIDHDGDLPSREDPVPFMTVPAALAETLGESVEFVDNLEHGKWYLVREAVTVDGGSFVRYSARYEKGFAIMVR